MENIPQLPKEYIDIALQTVANANAENIPPQNSGSALSFSGRDRTIIKYGKKSISRGIPRYGLEDQLGDWINKNISTEWAQISVANSTIDYANGGTPADNIHCPHTDRTRQYVLMYLLVADNPDQTTIFYQEPGYGVHRQRGLFHQNIDSLKEIDSFIMPLHEWVYFDVSILHSVENILGNRTAIQISFECEPFGIFVKE